MTDIQRDIGRLEARQDSADERLLIHQVEDSFTRRATRRLSPSKATQATAEAQDSTMAPPTAPWSRTKAGPKPMEVATAASQASAVERGRP